MILQITAVGPSLPASTSALPPGSVTFLATAEDVVHNDFVTRAWGDDPLAAVLAKIPGYSRMRASKPRRR